MTGPDVAILIVEDEALFASKMEMQVIKLDHACVGIVDNSEDALRIVREHRVDLVLMDININGDYDGVEVADMILDLSPDTAILFITSNEDELSFNRASRIEGAGFLVKPFTDLQLQRSIALSLKQKTAPSKEVIKEEAPEISDGYIFIRKQKEIAKVACDDIYFLEADGKYCKIYTQGEKYLVRQSLKSMADRLSAITFVHCHRSYVVNLSKIKSVNLEDDTVILEERTLPLSRREKDKLLERLNYL